MLDWSEISIEINILSSQRDEYLNLKQYKEAKETQQEINLLGCNLYAWISCEILK